MNFVRIDRYQLAPLSHATSRGANLKSLVVPTTGKSDCPCFIARREESWLEFICVTFDLNYCLIKIVR